MKNLMEDDFNDDGVFELCEKHRGRLVVKYHWAVPSSVYKRVIPSVRPFIGTPISASVGLSGGPSLVHPPLRLALRPWNVYKENR